MSDLVEWTRLNSGLGLDRGVSRCRRAPNQNRRVRYARMEAEPPLVVSLVFAE